MLFELSVISVTYAATPQAFLSGISLPPNSARIGYTTEGALLIISAQLSNDAVVSALERFVSDAG